MNNFKYGTKYSFKTKAPFVLGNKYDNMKYAGTVDFSIANRNGLNCILIHRQIYHLLGNATPDNAKLYLYHMFFNEEGVLRIFGDPWIDSTSISVGSKINVNVSIKNILNDDVSLIDSTLKNLGYTSYVGVKTKSKEGISGSIYNLVTGKTPVGGGLEDNEDEGSWNDDEGSTSIAKPIVTSKGNVFNPYITIYFSEFVDMLQAKITHVSTDIEVSTSTDFTNLVYSNYNETTNLNSVSYLGDKLLDGTKYYIRVRYTSSTGVKSKWSTPYQFTYSEYYTAPSGRRFKRHSSGIGTTMLWTDNSGASHLTVILDAAYRNKYKFIKENIDSTTIESYTSEPASFPLSITDKELKDKAGYIEDNRAAKETCEFYFNLDKSANTAIGWCRGKEISNNGEIYKATLPNIQQAIRIQSDSYVLDKLDPTSSKSSYNLLVDTKAIWSCTKQSTIKDNDTYETYIWYIDKDGNTDIAKTNYILTIVPVVELS